MLLQSPNITIITGVIIDFLNLSDRRLHYPTTPFKGSHFMIALISFMDLYEKLNDIFFNKHKKHKMFKKVNFSENTHRYQPKEMIESKM